MSANLTTTQGELSPLATPQAVVESLFTSTSCYELMQSSSKGTVFETTIPFQLAFFALIEHETDVAPLWDPELRSFVGLMTVSDYIRALRLCQFHNINAMELTTKSISDMLIATPFIFGAAGFQGIDAEDNVLSLVKLAFSNRLDSIPILDPDNGNLVSILGPLDVLHLLDQIARLNESIFNVTLSSLRLGSYDETVQFATKSTSIATLFALFDERDISSVPIVDNESSRIVIGVYHRADVSFIMKASDPEAVLENLQTFTVEDSMNIREQMLSSGEVSATSLSQTLVTIRAHETLGALFQALVSGKAHRAIIVDEQGRLKGVVSYRDLIRHLLASFAQNW